MNSPWLLVFAPYAASYFFSYLLRNVNAVIAPYLARDFGLGASDLGLLTAAYLVGFALMQLPLGLALDRYGPRRVVASLLLVAALGCLLFASAESLLALVLARGLIGIGVSACLMAGFKAFSLAFPAGQRAALNAAIMAAGGLGALSATVPLNAVLGRVSWLTVFVFLAGLACVLALLLVRTPEGHVTAATASGTWRQQVAELRAIFVGRAFWCFAPLTGMVVGGFIAVQGLWSAYWLSEVQGLTQVAVSQTLMQLNIGLITGYIVIASLLLLPDLKIPFNRLLMTGSVLILACQGLIVGEVWRGSRVWFCYGASSALMNLAYTSHAAHYPLALQGRANTCLNLAIFICGFAVQWGMGALSDFGQLLGWQTAFSFRCAWILLIALQLAGLLYFILYVPKRGRDPT